MKSFLHFKITFLMISSLIPWPEPSQTSAGCSREFSFLVRSFVTKKWTPIFEKFKVDIPLSCPLNLERDIFHLFHQSKFQVESRKWSCSICGKSFHKEPFLDLHLFRKHSEKLQLAEDTICPADFCDLVRCEVLQFAEVSRNRTSDFQNSKERQQTVTALVKATPQMSPISRHNNIDRCLTNDEQCKKKGWLILPSQLPQLHCCVSNETVAQCRPNESETSLPTSKEEELSARIKQKQSSCRDEDFVQLRSDCARLIDSCSAGLILRMTNQQFIHLRDELNRTVCWHLQCDRYWTEVMGSEASTSKLLLMAIVFAAVGMASSYIIVCVLCQEIPSVARKQEVTGLESRFIYNGIEEWTLPKRNSDACLKRLSSSFISEAYVEENSLI